MWWPGGGRAPYLLSNGPTFYTFVPILGAQLRPVASWWETVHTGGFNRHVYTSMQMYTYNSVHKLSRIMLHDTCSHLHFFSSLIPPHNEALYVNTIVDREKHTRSVLNAHPQPLLIQKAEVLNDWTPHSLVSTALTGLTCMQTMNPINYIKAFGYIEILGSSRVEQLELAICEKPLRTDVFTSRSYRTGLRTSYKCNASLIWV